MNYQIYACKRIVESAQSIAGGQKFKEYGSEGKNGWSKIDCDLSASN